MTPRTGSFRTAHRMVDGSCAIALLTLLSRRVRHPEVGGGHASPRRPLASRFVEGSGRIRGETLERASEAEVAGGERVAFAEPQRDVVGGPRTEAGERSDRGDELVECGAAVERQRAGPDRLG